MICNWISKHYFQARSYRAQQHLLRPTGHTERQYDAVETVALSEFLRSARESSYFSVVVASAQHDIASPIPHAMPPIHHRETTMKKLRRKRFGLVAAGLVASAVIGMPRTALADEGGVSFWIPGFFGSLAATPQQPGWSVATHLLPHVCQRRGRCRVLAAGHARSADGKLHRQSRRRPGCGCRSRNGDSQLRFRQDQFLAANFP